MGVCMCGFCNVWVFWQLCGCYGNMCACIYCVLYCLYCVFVLVLLCIFILIYFVSTSIRTIATEWKLNCSNDDDDDDDCDDNNNNNNNNMIVVLWHCTALPVTPVETFFKINLQSFRRKNLSLWGTIRRNPTYLKEYRVLLHN